MRIPNIAIGLQGNLEAIMRNRWKDGVEDVLYSLLRHARVLTIRGNSGAVQDLAAYVTGEFTVGDLSGRSTRACGSPSWA